MVKWMPGSCRSASYSVNGEQGSEKGFLLEQLRVLILEDFHMLVIVLSHNTVLPVLIDLARLGIAAFETAYSENEIIMRSCGRKLALAVRGLWLQLETTLNVAADVTHTRHCDVRVCCTMEMVVGVFEIGKRGICALHANEAAEIRYNQNR